MDNNNNSFEKSKETDEVAEILLDVLIQACGVSNGKFFEEIFIDNRCISAFENACDYLQKKGWLATFNHRTYRITK